MEILISRRDRAIDISHNGWHMSIADNGQSYGPEFSHILPRAYWGIYTRGFYGRYFVLKKNFAASIPRYGYNRAMPVKYNAPSKPRPINR